MPKDCGPPTNRRGRAKRSASASRSFAPASRRRGKDLSIARGRREGLFLLTHARTHTHAHTQIGLAKYQKKGTYIVSMRGIDSEKWYTKITAMSRLQVRFFGHMMMMRKCGAVRAIQAKCGEVIQTSSTKRPRRFPIHGEHRDEKRYGQYNNHRNLNPISRLPSESQCIMKWSLLWIHCLCSAPAFG